MVLGFLLAGYCVITYIVMFPAFMATFESHSLGEAAFNFLVFLFAPITVPLGLLFFLGAP